jgi:7,8-dihydropterin-6-yl-methyl-4-(beta-D-ribofuranosyl)aminobenzene 5'-phosphate synthase
LPTIRITSLIENSRLEDRPDLVAEHGVSLHIQHGDTSLLFDTGASGAFADNAARLGVDLGAVHLAVISHHHYDHGGGLERFFQENHRATVYLGRTDLGACHVQVLGLLHRHIGFDRRLLQIHPERFEPVEGTRELAPGVFALAQIPTPHAVPPGNRVMYLDQGGTFVADHFDHELLLVLRGDDGLIVITGCSHRGILNIVEAVVARFPEEPIRALIGGFHLMGLPAPDNQDGCQADIEQLARDLGRHPIERAYTGHCTGDSAYEVLHSILGDRLTTFPTGRVIELRPSPPDLREA